MNKYITKYQKGLWFRIVLFLHYWTIPRSYINEYNQSKWNPYILIKNWTVQLNVC